MGGRRVEIRGLVKKPELNGKPGTLQKLHDETGRWEVKVDKIDEVKMVLPANLVLQGDKLVPVGIIMFQHEITMDSHRSHTAIFSVVFSVQALQITESDAWKPPAALDQEIISTDLQALLAADPLPFAVLDTEVALAPNPDTNPECFGQ
eukprot:NODE_2051_length_515_cov_427.916309_g1674_i0.p1 GENE.NODE_2051_length_515_cov_427.916309_g1674_i0~~NODE_2051_length_515_cov_427.916309_g1674_i0.p1  ORF type:complete len:149 (-),score=12.65 NODE_2051_length_515_cov_427.916309_g1674_i0:37-483(-)